MNGILKVLMFPLKVGGRGVIYSVGGTPMRTNRVFQFGFEFGPFRYRHNLISIVRLVANAVKAFLPSDRLSLPIASNARREAIDRMAKTQLEDGAYDKLSTAGHAAIRGERI